MNLGVKPELNSITNINLATPIGALLNLQGIELGENQEPSAINFETVLANASLENEVTAESPQITPHTNSQISLETPQENLPSETNDVLSSSQINRDAVIDSPKLAANVINYPTLVQEIVQPEPVLAQPKTLQTEALPTEVLEAVRGFEIENEVTLSDAQLHQVAAIVQTKISGEQKVEPKIKHIAEVEDKKSPVILRNTEINTAIDTNAVTNVIIPASNNFAINTKQPKAEVLKGNNAEQNSSKLVIKTSLPINARDIELIQAEKFFSEVDSEFASDMSEEKFIARLNAKPDETFVLAERSKDPLPIHKIAHYQEKGIPIENRSQNITHQVVKVLSNLETKTQSITVQLDPVELGKIDIKMDISPKGETKVMILAEKLETYALLTKSSEQIQSILTDKGLNQDSTSLNFGLRHGNSNGNQNHPQFASARKESKDLDSDVIKTINSHLFYSDPDRLDIKA
jgi:flagellar hook-length control protein FliK